MEAMKITSKILNIFNKALASAGKIFNMCLRIFSLCVYLFTVMPYLTSAMTDEQIKKIHEEFQMLGMECLKDHVISESDISDLKSHKVPSGDKVPCFLACMMKKSGIMNDQGMLQNEKAVEKAKQIFDDEEELKKIQEYLHSCSHINTESVGDGDKGCDRALLAYKCMIDNASQKDFSWLDLDKTINQLYVDSEKTRTLHEVAHKLTTFGLEI